MARPKAAVDYDGEISNCDEMIARYKAKRQRLLLAKTQDENERIITLVRGNKLSLDELNNALGEYMVKKSHSETSPVSEAPAAKEITDAQSVIKEENE